MMRRLREEDRKQVLDYLYQETNYNIFPIGDIEHFGFDNEFQQVYATVAPDGSITSMFLRYRDNGIFYTDGIDPIDPYLPIIQQDKLRFVSMKEPLANRAQIQLNEFDMRTMFFCAYDATNSLIASPNDNVLVISTESECGELYDLLCQIKEFHIDRETRDDFITSKLISMQMGTILYVRDNDVMVSTVATTAETTRNAMVVGVATLPHYRNRGHASLLMRELIRRYQIKGKDLCLFYDNPDAGSIYHRLGFQDIGKWAMFERRD